MRTIYLGDEAIVELERFSLEGRPIRKVRQSVHRLSKAGYVAELRPLDELDGPAVDEVEEILERGREGAPERGFSMAMDSIRSRRARTPPSCSLAIRTARSGACSTSCPSTAATRSRCPSCGVTLATPNGMTEFLVVKAVELLRERGVAEMSLNFAAFAKWMHSPEKRSERFSAS